jgi:dihydrofolate reductase
MKISLIAAVDEAWGIAQNDRIPWKLSQDLQRFKRLTLGHHLLMGRKTYETIGNPLPGRISIVITRQNDYTLPEEFNDKVYIARSISAGIRLAEENLEQELFVIGGGQIYAQALPQADCIYLTRVHILCECDTFFPILDPQDWSEIHQENVPADEKNQFASTFTILSHP